MSGKLPVDSVMQETGENDYSDSPLLNNWDDVGIQLLCNAAVRQGLEVHYHRRLIFEVFNQQQRVVFRQNSPGNSAVFTYCARQKQIAKDIMAENGVPVPSGGIFENYSTALRYFQQAGAAVTVKPNDGSSGAGVSSNVTSEEEFKISWVYARKHGRQIIVEQNVFGEDIRVIVIAGVAQAAYVRIPAHVVGDGESSIRHLVERKNALRKRNPSLRLDLIKRFDLLERQNIALDHVPSRGEKVQLTTVANASAGGETVQIFDRLDREVLAVAEQAAQCFPGLIQVGVDLIYTGNRKADNPGQRSSLPPAYVIEVNSNPGICDAVFPSYGRPIDVPGKLISHVFSSGALNQEGRSPVQIALARPYRYGEFDRAFRRGALRSVDLIAQAAYAHNLQLQSLSDTVFSLDSQESRCMFHGGMPQSVLMVTRKITRNRSWMDEILPSSVGFRPEDKSRLKRFRLLVVGRRLVSVLHIRETGGDRASLREDVSDLVHPSVLPVIESTLAAIYDPHIVGIDLFVDDISAEIDGQPWLVQDAVCNPQLGWHHFPDRGLGRDIAGALVQSLFPEVVTAEPPVKGLRLLIGGHVQGVGFRRWLKLMAIRHSVSGWVKNLPDGSVEVLLEGSPTGIAALEKLCQKGPADAKVDSVNSEEICCTGRLAFTAIA
ncbi:acylphosphatase [Microbulbifer mangrovi]|uniref:acylphosphatase n=1 Tax=Microbulbifer mangrovi TaxID=927787 RepID=UPI0009908C48|nr:acylphosphatase [Microbulbifer mangrovi]